MCSNTCFDTSVLVAALLQQHPAHAAAFPHLKSVRDGRIKGHLTTHALAELFATLTALPLRPRLSPADAQALIQTSILPHFQLVPLSSKSYLAALSLATSQNLSSGAVYDALHVVGARASKCERLLTLNLRHFKALAPGEDWICEP